jgi:hypothetical protein
LLVMKYAGEVVEIAYDGPGAPAWAAAGRMAKNGQRSISLSKLRGIAKFAIDGIGILPDGSVNIVDPNSPYLRGTLYRR